MFFCCPMKLYEFSHKSSLSQINPSILPQAGIGMSFDAIGFSVQIHRVPSWAAGLLKDA